ncbi:MAG: hypothetical protein H6661_09415 [Ardenticatenaceae bacterium]|nr:hypothetical protein [Ardenticatenaceae bacterium]
MPTAGATLTAYTFEMGTSFFTQDTARLSNILQATAGRAALRAAKVARTDGASGPQELIRRRTSVDTALEAASATPLAMTAVDGNFSQTIESVRGTVDFYWSTAASSSSCQAGTPPPITGVGFAQFLSTCSESGPSRPPSAGRSRPPIPQPAF